MTGGTINRNGAPTIRVTNVGADTVLAQIVQMGAGASRSKARTQKLADRVAVILVAIAIVAFIVWLIFGPQAAFIFAIACPCALGLRRRLPSPQPPKSDMMIQKTKDIFCLFINYVYRRRHIAV